MPLNHSKLLIRVDTEIGVRTDRVRNMHALAREFMRRDGEVSMVTNEIPNTLRRRIEKDGIRVHQILSESGSENDGYDTLEVMALLRPDWLAVDGPNFDSKYISQVSRVVNFVLSTDGLERYITATDRYQAKRPVQAALHRGAQRLTGPAFALIDRPNTAQPTNKKIVAKAKKVLVWYDGADEENWTLKTLQSLSDLASRQLVVDCLLSPNYKHHAELDEFRRVSNVTLRLHKNLDRLCPLAERADLAIANGHSGCYQLAYLGVPTILVSTPETNLKIINTLHTSRSGFSVAHGTPNGQLRPSDLAAAVKKMLSDRFKRHSLSRHAMDLIDGRGANRIVDRMALHQTQVYPTSSAA